MFPRQLPVLAATWLLFPIISTAEPQPATELAPITIHAPRIDTTWQDSPAAVTLIDPEDIGRGRTRLQPTDPLMRAPGVLVVNRDNFAQNPRVSIRGFGARAPFGIRGVRIRLDGIPLTTVDGQAQIDAIDPFSLAGIEVMRGANAVLHGNASGGLLDYRSRRGGGEPSLEAGMQTGGFGLRRLNGAMAGEGDNLAWRGAVADLHQEGYRAHSAVKRRNGGLWLDHQQGNTDWFVILNHLDNPLAEDPGGLTEDEWRDNVRQAAPLAERMNARQRVRQNIASVGFVHELGQPDHRLHAQTWLTERDFSQQLPFPGDSLVSYERQILGGTLEYHRPLGRLSLLTSLDLEQQQDKRQRHCRNVNGEPVVCPGLSDDLALDQHEEASNAGLALQLAGPIGDNEQGRWLVGLRHDRLRLAIDDQLQAGGLDRSGRRQYNETHYSLGYSHGLSGKWHLFTQYATSFEAPTFTEFANPEGSGFRPGLKPQYSRSLEVGLRGTGQNHSLETALFTVRVKDELIVDDDPGAAEDDERTFYRNAERTRRDGLELGGRWWPAPFPSLELGGALTLMQARFDDANGNDLPGLPRISAVIDAELDLGQGYFGALEVQHLGPRYADDANTVRVASQSVAGLRLGREWSSGRQQTRLVLGIENLFDARHLSNLRINAANGRYFEPGAERRLYMGIEMVLH
jgi:iron complex outermembrane recepter protein